MVEEWEEAKKDPEQKDDFPDCKNNFPKDTIKAAKLIEEWWKEDKEEVEKALKEWEEEEKTILKKRRLDQTLHKRLVEVQSEIRSIKLNLLEWNNRDKVNEALIMLQDGITHLR